MLLFFFTGTSSPRDVPRTNIRLFREGRAYREEVVHSPPPPSPQFLSRVYIHVCTHTSPRMNVYYARTRRRWSISLAPFGQSAFRVPRSQQCARRGTSVRGKAPRFSRDSCINKSRSSLEKITIFSHGAIIQNYPATRECTIKSLVIVELDFKSVLKFAYGLKGRRPKVREQGARSRIFASVGAHFSERLKEKLRPRAPSVDLSPSWSRIEYECRPSGARKRAFVVRRTVT